VNQWCDPTHCGRLCVRWGPVLSSRERGQSPLPNFLAHFCRGKTAGCIKMPLGIEVGLSPGDFVLDVDPAPHPKKGAEPPKFLSPCLLWPNGWMDQDGTWHGGRPQPRRLCVRWGPSPLLPKKGAEPLPNFWPFSIVTKRLDAPRCHLVWR